MATPLGLPSAKARNCPSRYRPKPPLREGATLTRTPPLTINGASRLQPSGGCCAADCSHPNSWSVLSKYLATPLPVTAIAFRFTVGICSVGLLRPARLTHESHSWRVNASTLNTNLRCCCRNSRPNTVSQFCYLSLMPVVRPWPSAAVNRTAASACPLVRTPYHSLSPPPPRTQCRG